MLSDGETRTVCWDRWFSHLLIAVGCFGVLGLAILWLTQDLARYIGVVLEDGDYLNDWLTHLPEGLQGAVLAFGKLLAGAIGPIA